MDGNSPLPAGITRRGFVVTSLTATGGLAIGMAFPGLAKAAMIGTQPWSKETAEHEINAFLEIAPDGAVTFRSPHSEMGQGTTTALAMIIAEELEADWTKIKVEYASANRNLKSKNVYGNMRTTGSSGVRTSYHMLQQAGASARERLIAAAAKRWKVAADQCEAKDGKVAHKASGRNLGYGALAADAAKIQLVQEPAIRPPEEFKLIGKPMGRLDVPLKINGSAQFAIDTRIPGMVYAAVSACPVFGGKLKSVDDAKIKGRRGILRVVKLDDAVAVVADRYWRAKNALGDLAVVWDFGAGAGTSTEQFKKFYRDKLDGAMTNARNDGDVDNALKGAKVIEAVYEAPHLAHAQMEPLNATAHVQAGRVDVWIGSQSPMNAIELAAQASGLPPEQCYVHNCYLGGGFGRRSMNDEMVHAILVSKAIGKPVKLVRTREEDMTHDRYRPQAAVRFRAALGADGLPTAFDCRTVVGSILRSSGRDQVASGVEPMAVDGLATTSYKIPNLRVACSLTNTHVPVYFWRSVGASQNAFFIESFIDELAHEAKQDPLKFRRALLAHRSDFTGVLDLLADKGDWGKPMQAGQGRGIAIHESFGSIVGETVEVTVSPKGEVRVDRVVAVVDCGHAVNPRTIEMQMEGGIIFGLSAALSGEITIKDGRVVQDNFDSYPVLRMADAPKIETYLALSGGKKWGGIGEPGLAPVAPAVANAVFAATGKRIRSLPIRTVNLGSA
ncbi:MAG: molybdopterin cofactor-binding domain-containing protein [Stellaceae bacterium]